MRVLALQVGAQLAALEDRQADGRADAKGSADAHQQVGRVQRGNAGEGGQGDGRQEFRARHLDILAGGLHAPARGNQVRAAAQQVDGEIVRQQWRALRQDGRALDRQAAVRALAQQRGELVARQQDIFIHAQQVGLCRCHRAARLRGFDLGVQAGVEPVARQVAQAAALGNGALGHVALRVHGGQPGVGAGDRRGQDQARGLAFGLGGAVVGQRGFQRLAVLAPEVEVIRKPSLQA